MQAFGEEAQLGEVGEAQVTVLVQQRGQIGEVEREGEERAASAAALVQPLLTGREKKSLLLQQGGFTIGLGLTAPAARGGFGRTDGGGTLAAAFPASPADFGGRDGRGWEGEFRS